MRYPETPTEQADDSSITDELVSGPGKRSRSEISSTAEMQGMAGHVRRQVNKYETEHPGSSPQEAVTAPVAAPSPPTKRLDPTEDPPRPVPVPYRDEGSSPEGVSMAKDFYASASTKSPSGADSVASAGMDPESKKSSVTGPDQYVPDDAVASKEQPGNMNRRGGSLEGHIVPPPAATAVAAFTAGEESGEESVTQERGSRRGRSRRIDGRFSSAALRRNTRAGSVCSSAPSGVPSVSSANSSPVRAPESEGSLLHHSGRTMTPELSTQRSIDSRRSSTHSGRAASAKFIVTAPLVAKREKDVAKDAEKEKPPFVCGTTTPKVVHADFETPFEALTSPKRSQTKQKPLRPKKEPPGPNASLNSQMQFIHYQLDCFSNQHNVLNGLSLLRTGPKQRFQSGAHSTHQSIAAWCFT